MGFNSGFKGLNC